MQLFHIVKKDVSVSPIIGVRNCYIIVKIRFLIFDRQSQGLNKNIINEGSTIIHADPDIFFFKSFSKF